MTQKEELRIKEGRIKEYLKAKRLDGILVSRQDHFAWLTCGGRSYVGIATDGGVGALLFMPPKKYVISNNIETDRLMDEEVGALGYKPVSFPWRLEAERKAAAVKKLIKGKRVASDDGIAGTRLLDADFTALRFSLTQAETARYRRLGRDCRDAMEQVCPKIRRGQREYEIAAAICSAFTARDVMPTVALIAADDRIKKYRHPIYTDKKVRNCVEVVMCGRRKGLILSLTRLVHFGRLPKALRRKHDAVCAVDAAYILASRPGTTLGDVLAAGIEVYRDTGFGEEWKLHHQGGPTGYAGRDRKGAPGDPTEIVLNQALAWNPSIAGTKSEDTIITGPRGVEVLSPPKNWPTVKTSWNGREIERADILVK